MRRSKELRDQNPAYDGMHERTLYASSRVAPQEYSLLSLHFQKISRRITGSHFITFVMRFVREIVFSSARAKKHITGQPTGLL